MVGFFNGRGHRRRKKGKYNVVCDLIHGGIWETKDLGASESSTPTKEVRETPNPSCCITSPRNCWSDLLCPGLLGSGLTFV